MMVPYLTINRQRNSWAAAILAIVCGFDLFSNTLADTNTLKIPEVVRVALKEYDSTADFGEFEYLVSTDRSELVKKEEAKDSAIKTIYGVEGTNKVVWRSDGVVQSMKISNTLPNSEQTQKSYFFTGAKTLVWFEKKNIVTIARGRWPGGLTPRNLMGLQFDMGAISRGLLDLVDSCLRGVAPIQIDETPLRGYQAQIGESGKWGMQCIMVQTNRFLPSEIIISDSRGMISSKQTILWNHGKDGIPTLASTEITGFLSPGVTNTWFKTTYRVVGRNPNLQKVSFPTMNDFASGTIVRDSIINETITLP